MMFFQIGSYIEKEVKKMKIRVRVKNKDNRFGGRNIEINFGDDSLKTPYRAANQKDFNAATSLPFKVTIENKISDFVNDFSTTALDSFLKSNGSLIRRSKNLGESGLLMRYSKNISSITIPNKKKIEDIDELKLFLLLQNDPNFHIISLPPFTYQDLDEYRNVVEDFCEKGIAKKKVVMPILHLSSDIETFKREFSVLRDLHKNDLVNIIGFKFAKIKTRPQQYLEIFRNREKDIWYHCIGVPRNNANELLAEIHELQNWGIDTYTPRARKLSQKQVGFLIYQNSQKGPSDLSVKRFDGSTLGILKEPSYIEKYGHNLNCDCVVCHNKDLNSFKETYSHDLSGSFDLNLLNYADKLHDLFGGNQKFETSRNSIRNDALHQYYNEREYAANKITPPNKTS